MKASDNTSFWQSLGHHLDEGRQAILLIVLDSEGSSPGRRGFMMSVLKDHTLLGSIGGGIMEHKLVELASSLLQDGFSRPILKRQVHRSTGSDRSGMICSGEQTVALYLLGEKNISLVREILNLAEENQKAYLLCNQDNLTLQIFSAETNYLRKADTKWSCVLPLFNLDHVYILGAGHVGLVLSGVMRQLGFRVHMYDHREDLNTMVSNKTAHYKEVIKYENIDQYIPDGDNIYIVIMTFGYRFDEICIRKLAGHRVRYTGVMGSESKMKKMMLSLQEEGISKDYLDKIHTPIGVKINSRTPEEIAVSIAAQIIDEKNK